MQSRGPPHGKTPSPPTDRSHSTHSSIPSSFHTPSPSSPPFFMNPLTDQRLTGPMMPYHHVDHHHALPSTSPYQDTVSWQYATSWDAPVLDAGASSDHPSSLGPLGMVSPSNEGSTFAPPLPPPRAAAHPRNTFLGAGHPCPPRPFLASPPSSSTSDAHETSVQFGGGGVNVSASSAPATTPPHLSQGAANPATMQPFTSSSEIWQPSHNTGVNLSPSPVTTTNVIGGIVASSLGENLKGRVMQGRSPTDSTRGSARYDPMGKQARFTSRASTSATPATAVAAPGSEQLTDEGDERDSDGSVRDVRDKKRKYAKTFRDMEKQLFEKLRHRLFPQDPHAKRSECLDRAIQSVDELQRLRESEARHQREIEDLRQQLVDAECRIERLYRELNGRSLTMGS